MCRAISSRRTSQPALLHIGDIVNFVKERRTNQNGNGNNNHNATMLVTAGMTTVDAPGFYNTQIAKLTSGDTAFAEVYHDLWATLFQPSPPVQHRIDSELQALKLQPGDYDSLHIRAQYLSLESGNDDMVRNATNCAAAFGFPSNDRPIYIASDSAVLASAKAVQHCQRQHRLAVVRNLTEAPFHLDRGKRFYGGGSYSTDEPPLRPFTILLSISTFWRWHDVRHLEGVGMVYVPIG
jgi:hypothetical protein